MRLASGASPGAWQAPGTCRPRKQLQSANREPREASREKRAARNEPPALSLRYHRELVKKANKGAVTPPPRGASDAISELTTNRLSVYLRCLTTLDAAAVRTVSSRALAEQFHLNAAQIRKDLAYFGEFGVRGVGY